MMSNKIIKAKYTEDTLNWVSLEFEDGSKGYISTTDDTRRQYTDVYDEWISEGNTPEPEFTVAEIATQLQQTINSEALSYLSSTDWYVTRQSETGVTVLPEILIARAEARLKIVKVV